MSTLNLVPVLDALQGMTATPATFKAVAMRAGRTAVRVDGATVSFPTEVTAVWDGTGWDAEPRLWPLPVDCYWKVRVAAAGSRLEGCYILPDASAEVDFGDLIPVTPDTGIVDTSTVAQYQATQRYVSNQISHIDATAATVFDLVGTVQAQIEAANQQIAAAQIVLANLTTAQAGLDADVTTVVTAATQTAADRAAIEALFAGRGTVDGNSATTIFTIDGSN